MAEGGPRPAAHAPHGLAVLRVSDPRPRLLGQSSRETVAIQEKQTLLEPGSPLSRSGGFSKAEAQPAYGLPRRQVPWAAAFVISSPRSISKNEMSYLIGHQCACVC